MSAPFDALAGIAVVPVIAIESVDHEVPLADALLEGGLPTAEITFRTAAAAEVLARLRDRRPELLLGAGGLRHGRVEAGRESVDRVALARARELRS
ncbi:4-hydroxy-2-oxoglutarate aldolase [Rubellimicrobium mesophilum DSM 19309]|uniref:2-dehydro-3-deoxy-phosphogluconate aldolase n=1 Tax=Rubellimicrobium mesophilum DSM 19309 TaxID=442562 RepID=A0A017HIE6_9RHOB|nr:hypothetical protein [Rubellimicrobium mesophilum]EYD74292.1 4-hydroxy-2-oxoglutarate aldolase [Rubellimicrobium mesophilum DSM 19309]